MDKGVLIEEPQEPTGCLPWLVEHAFTIALIAVWIPLILLISVFETGMFSDRTPIPERWIVSATSNRLQPWLVYLDDIDFYFREEPAGPAEDRPAGCQYVRDPLVIFQTPDIYVIVGDAQTYEWETQARYCLTHEIGHHIDASNGWISKSDRFQRLVHKSIAMWENLPEDVDGCCPYHWRGIGQMVAEFPGVNGNPLDENGWGGYGELYANLHEVSWLIQIPPPLQEYFDEFLFWTWHSVY